MGGFPNPPPNVAKRRLRSTGFPGRSGTTPVQGLLTPLTPVEVTSTRPFCARGRAGDKPPDIPGTDGVLPTGMPLARGHVDPPTPFYSPTFSAS